MHRARLITWKKKGGQGRVLARAHRLILALYDDKNIDADLGVVMQMKCAREKGDNAGLLGLAPIVVLFLPQVQIHLVV